MKYLLLLAICSVQAQITPERLNAAYTEPNNWLTYFGDYGGVRHRTLNQINSTNVQNLRLDWIYQTGETGAFETVPLVVDGVMYITAPKGIAVALDAKSGRQLWRYKHSFPEGRNLSGVNRGMAISGDRLFMVTPDSNVVALEAKTGRKIWQTEMAPYVAGSHYASLAPLVVKDKVLVGISGGEQGVRGFIDAYDVSSGKRVWRFYTIPLKGEPRRRFVVG